MRELTRNRSGKRYPGIRFPCILGADGVGEVVKVGDPKDGKWIGKTVIINPGMHWGSAKTHQSPNFRILGMPENGTFASNSL